MKNLFFSYILCVLGFMGIGGIHRFYLGKPISGLLYLATGGLCLIGTIIDLIQMPSLVNYSNWKDLNYNINNNLSKHSNRPSSSFYEKRILQIARKHNGYVTAQIVAIETSLSLLEAQAKLEQLKKNNFCALDIAEDGSELYNFPGLKVTQPI